MNWEELSVILLDMAMALYQGKKMSAFSGDTYHVRMKQQLHDWLESESEPRF